MRNRRIAWVNCASGIAGDMFLGALLDAGASQDYVEKILGDLHLEGWSLKREIVQRSGITATHVTVIVQHSDHVRTYASILELINRAKLPERITQRSLATFEALATVEASLHGVAINDVHFHEVGGHDAIVDIVGTIAALEDLDIDAVFVAPIALGTGSISIDHGVLPNPAPATVALLEGFLVEGTTQSLELATPTGAALVRVLGQPLSAQPPTIVIAQGFGAGTRDLVDQANVVGVVIAEQPSSLDEMVGLVETTVDDVTGEVLGSAMAGLLDHGALDAWATPVAMKKGRPGTVVTVLCEPTMIPTITTELMRATGTLGVRTSLVTRTILQRTFITVSVLNHDIQLKVSNVRAKPEFDDVKRVAEATGRTHGEIDALAMAAYIALQSS